MLTTQRVYTEAELRSRYEIMLENYCKTVCIEAQTMSDMARKQILPAVAHYAADVARDASGKQALDPDIRCGYEAKLVKKLTAVAESIDTRCRCAGRRDRQVQDSQRCDRGCKFHSGRDALPYDGAAGRRRRSGNADGGERVAVPHLR